VSHAQLIHDTWESISKGEFGPLEAVLAPDAKWRAVEDGPWNCENRAMIVEAMRYNRETGVAGDIEEILEFGDRAVVGFRPTHLRSADAWPLDDGIRYVVVTTANGLVTELKGCANRQVALAYIDDADRFQNS
jgi:hypothetical protein